MLFKQLTFKMYLCLNHFAVFNGQIQPQSVQRITSLFAHIPSFMQIYTDVGRLPIFGLFKGYISQIMRQSLPLFRIEKPTGLHNQNGYTLVGESLVPAAVVTPAQVTYLLQFKSF